MATLTVLHNNKNGGKMQSILATIIAMVVFCTSCKNQNVAAVAKNKPMVDSVQTVASANKMNSAGFFSVLEHGQGNLWFDRAVNVVFKSNDGGQTWQDISEGLPENPQRDGFFADEDGLFLHSGNGLFHSASNSTIPFWTKVAFPDDHNSIAPGKHGIVAFNSNGQFLQRVNGTGSWEPVYSGFQGGQVRTVFESEKGIVFVGSEKGLFRSTNNGNTWKQVQQGGWAMKLVESNGVLIATSQKGIIRSADNGETWDVVISEGGVGIAVEKINGGFAAITYNTKSETRRVRTSYDGGKTWQFIDAGLPPSPMIASIIQVGDYFICGHPDGIYRSSDKGKTWKLILPSVENKVFNLSGAGRVIYAVAKEGGC
jgi:photosystem II stability/assembly factor-like uncharacterized protein